MNYLFIIILNKCVYFITTRILLLFPDKKRLNTRYPINACPRLKSFLCDVAPVWLSGKKLITWLVFSLDLKVKNSDILNTRQFTLPISSFEKNNWEQTMEINLKARQGKFFKYDKQLVGIE